MTARSLLLFGILASATLASANCTPAVDPAAVAAIQVSNTGEAPRGCRLLGPLVGKDNNRFVPGGPRVETAMFDLRQKAVQGGGNYLVTDAIVPPGDNDYDPTFVVRARLFACPGGIAADAGAPSPSPPPGPPPPANDGGPAGTAPAATPTCEPDCSPGYTCVRGTCVSACNPACSKGERCGADRVCHPLAAVPAPSAVPP